MSDRLEHAVAFAKTMRQRKYELKGFIYLIGCHEFVKVGIALNPKRRLTNLQMGCPYELKLLATFQSDWCLDDERIFHELWKAYEVRGEWFKVPAGELAFVLNAQNIEEIVIQK